MNEFLETKVRGGVIRCYPNVDPDNPGVSVMYQPNGCDFEMDLVYIENTQLELEQTKEPEDMRVMVYDNVFSEDYQHSFTIRQQDVKELVDSVQKDDTLVGTITLGETCDLTDPCYDKDTWCRQTLESMLPGKYLCFAEIEDCEMWGKRVVSSKIEHESYDDMELHECELIELPECCVDSGLFGYFNNKPDYTDAEWDDFCDKLQERAKITGNVCDVLITDDGGFVTSSGFGDDVYYPVAYRNKDGKIVSVEMVFIEEEEYEDD